MMTNQTEQKMQKSALKQVFQRMSFKILLCLYLYAYFQSETINISFTLFLWQAQHEKLNTVCTGT